MMLLHKNREKHQDYPKALIPMYPERKMNHNVMIFKYLRPSKRLKIERPKKKRFQSWLDPNNGLT